MRMGIFGGTFDPVHLGHLIVAEQCREQGQLDQVRFLPAAHPPHKPQPATPFAQRAEMLALAISGNAAFVVDEIESERPGPSYTADTLAELRRRHPDAELYLIVGSDTLQDLPRWYQPGRILEQATLLITARAGWSTVPPEALRAALPSGVPLRYQVVETPLITIASRDLRRRIAESRSIRYQAPRVVEAYIHEKGLYGSTNK